MKKEWKRNEKGMKKEWKINKEDEIFFTDLPGPPTRTKQNRRFFKMDIPSSFNRRTIGDKESRGGETETGETSGGDERGVLCRVLQTAGRRAGEMGGSWEDLLWVDWKFPFYRFCPIFLCYVDDFKTFQSELWLHSLLMQMRPRLRKGCNTNFDLLFWFFCISYVLCLYFLTD